ncbi:MAG TPA: transporter substrate-binding domain-containing protein [Telluria sp.]
MQLPAAAGCSRPINVPAAATGQSITINGAQVGGMIPDMLNQIGARIGCTFRWSPVPRQRLEAMFVGGSADLMVAATQVDRRDRAGIFVPVVETRPTLISVDSERAAIHTVADLLARRELRVALVRGYDYGPAYQAMIQTLTSQGRLYLQPDARTVARMLADAMADVTIMPASAFIGSLQSDARIEGLASKLRVEALEELPWIRSGIYLSKSSLTAPDRALLHNALTASVNSGVWWQAFKRYYPSAVLHDNTRPIEALR